MTYVDDVNCLLPLEDVKEFTEKFSSIGTKLGANPNTSKTQILTSTHGKCVVDQLLASSILGIKRIGASLQRTITNYSAKASRQREDGLRILGVPIGSQIFCQDFIANQVKKMEYDLENILEGLEDLQNQLQLFKTCTSHKMTHLFAADVLYHNKLPQNWHLWDSPTTNSITHIYSNFIAKLSNRSLIPTHALLISSISINKG